MPQGKRSLAEPRDLDGHKFIAIAGRPSEWLMGDHRRAAPRTTLTTIDEDAAAAAAVAGLGLVQLPDYVDTSALADGRLERVLTGLEPPAAIVHASFEEDAGVESGDWSTRWLARSRVRSGTAPRRPAEVALAGDDASGRGPEEEKSG